MLSDKVRNNTKPLIKTKMLTFVIIYSLLVEISTLFLTFITLFRENTQYIILMISVICLLLPALRLIDNERKYVDLFLFILIVYHNTLLSFPLPRVYIHEGGVGLAKLVLEGRWDPDNPPNPIYGPFPMFGGLTVILSIVASIPAINPLSGWIVSLTLIFAFDLTIYYFTFKLTKNRVAGLFAILLLSLTPPTNLVKHIPKWTGMLLVLISISALIKVFTGKRIEHSCLAILSYIAAIFYHPSAIIGILLLSSIIIVSYFANYIVEGEWERFSKNKLLRILLISFTLITLVRAMCTSGYLEVALPPLEQFILTAFGYTSAVEAYTPVYEQKVRWINSLAWSNLPSLASAYIIYRLLKKKYVERPLLLFIFITGAGFSFIGWLFAISKAVYASYRAATYVAFALLAPIAATGALKIVKSFKALSLVLTTLIVISSGLALTDPMLSPIKYAQIGAQDIPANEYDYIEARFLINVLPQDRQLLVPSEISSCLSYLTVTEGKPSLSYYKPGGAGYLRLLLDDIIYNKRLVPDIIYIWSPRWYPEITVHLNEQINVYYDSGRHVVFDKV